MLSQSPLQVDLLILQTKCKKVRRTKKHKNNISRNQNDVVATESCIDKKADKKSDGNQNLDLENFILDQPPCLIRSKSWSQGLRTPSLFCEDHDASWKRSRSNSCTETFWNTKPSWRSNASFFIQQLLPDSVRPSILGPQPRASLTVISKQRRAAVLILWTMGALPKVVPLVGCDWEVAYAMEQDIWVTLDLPCSIQNPVSFYLIISQHLASNLYQWTGLLEARIVAKESKKSKWKQLLVACAKSGISTGITYDQFDLFQVLEAVNNTKPKIFQSHEKASVDSELSCVAQVCLVCFEEIQDDNCKINQLLPCGHFTCNGCLTAYFSSAVHSGESSIKCPAFKCNTKLGITESAHVLFSQGEDKHSQHIFEKLNEYNRTKNGVHLLHDTFVRFFPTPSCDHVLKRCTNTRQNDGFNLMICKSCGISCCGDCSEMSHPGIPCATFSKLRKEIDSGRLDDELATVKWRLKILGHGCNHVCCSQCQYYFCWECGGLGYECLAYSCKNMSNYWDKDRDYDQNNQQGMAILVKQYRAYRQTEGRLNWLRRPLMGNQQCNDSTMVLEIQLLQVILWQYSARFVNTMAKSSVQLVSPLQDLELLGVHSLLLRTMMQSHCIKYNNTETFRTIELASVVGVQNNKELRKRKQQAKEKMEASRMIHDDCSFHKLIADQNISELCTMSNSEFKVRVNVSIQQGIKSLLWNALLGISRRKKKPSKIS